VARSFNGTSDVITCTMSTSVANWLFGTMVAVVKRANNTNWNGPLCRVQSGGAAESFLDVAPSGHASVNALWCDYASSATTASNTPKVLAADGWVLVGTTKATGSVAPTFYYYVFNTGVWTRVAGVAQGDSIGAAGGSITLGNTVGDFFAGDIDVLAFFPTALSQAQMDTLPTSLAAWDALTPNAMWVLNQASIATPVPDRTGNGANQSAISGTTIAATSSPLTIDSGYGRTGTALHPGRGPSRYARFLQSARHTVAAVSGTTQVAVGQASEVDTTQAVARLKSKAVGQPAETDTTQPAGRLKVRALGQPADTGTAQPIRALKLRVAGQALEVDVAQQVGRRKARTVGQGTETGLTQPVSRLKSRVLGQPSESDLAQPISRQGTHQQAVGQAAEVDTAQSIRAIKIRALGQALESDLAQAINRRRSRTIGEPLEVDLAQAIARRKVRVLGQVVETDSAQAVGHGGAVTRREFWGMVV